LKQDLLSQEFLNRVQELSERATELEAEVEILRPQRDTLLKAAKENVDIVDTVLEAILLLMEVPDLRLREQIEGAVRNLKMEKVLVNGKMVYPIPPSGLALANRIRVL
jgi:hypothetical protein